MKLNELSALISVREFAVKIFDNIYFKMNTDEVRALRTKIGCMDRAILDEMLKLEFASPEESSRKKNEATK